MCLDATLPDPDFIHGIHQFTHQVVVDNGGAKGFKTLGWGHHNAGVVDRIPEIELARCIHKGADNISFDRGDKRSIR